jgi:transposase InsO family protein
MKKNPGTRLTRVLDGAGIPRSSWYRDASSDRDPATRKRPGPGPKPVPAEIESKVVETAMSNPWYGYRKIAVICRREGTKVNNRTCYRVMKKHNLLRKPAKRVAEVYQAAKLYELLPTKVNALWQMDVTYVHIPGSGWWYAITVIDYYSRYLLALRLAPSYAATEVLRALKEARAEAERIHGPLQTKPFLVTDNGSSFIAKRFLAGIADGFTHVRIQYRTPQQLGLLERFHRTLQDEEVYWRLYEGPGHARECLAEFRARYNERRPHWALVPESGGDPVTPEDVYRHGLAIRIPRWQGWAREAKRKLEEMLGDGARVLQKAG